MASLRLLLSPLSGETNGSDSGPLAGVRGANLRITHLGAGSTLAARNNPQPATIAFLVRLLDEARRQVHLTPKEVGRISGIVELGTDGVPRFGSDGTELSTIIDPSEPLEDGSSASSSSNLRRKLRIEFDSSHFPEFTDGLDLILPDLGRARYLELCVVLEIAGVAESAESVNDILDVPLKDRTPEPVPSFEVRVVDEVGEPIEGVDVLFEVTDERVNKTTNERGLARLFKLDASVAQASFPEPSMLKNLLGPRWDKARVGARVRPSESTLVSSVGKQVEPLLIEAGNPKLLSIQPQVERARLMRFFFDSNKTFLLPDLPAASEKIQELYQRNTPSKLLVVGHADTSGGVAYNDKLSLERAETLLAYLRDDVEQWLAWYGNSIPSQKRWGSAEDLAMIGALPDQDSRDPEESPVFWFQRTRGLKLDGIAGPETRRALVSEYLALDGATLADEIEPTVHGCGEHFPESGAPDGTSEPDDRRAELFFFDPDLGIQPRPPGKNSQADSPEYNEWVRRAELFDVASVQLQTVVIRVLDALHDPLPDAPYEFEVGSERRTGRTDSQGLVIERNVEVPNRCTLRWNLPEEDSDLGDLPNEFLFEKVILLDYAELDGSDDDEAARRRLQNLGYDEPQLVDNVRAFQKDFELAEAAWFDQTTFDRLKQIHDSV